MIKEQVHWGKGVEVEESTLVCKQAKLNGHITIGANCIIHPEAEITCLNESSILIGNNNIIEESVKIINSESSEMVIGDYNHIEAASNLENCRKVGSYNTIRSKAYLGLGSYIEDNCVIGVMVNNPQMKKLESNLYLDNSGNILSISQDNIQRHTKKIENEISLLKEKLMSSN